MVVNELFIKPPLHRKGSASLGAAVAIPDHQSCNVDFGYDRGAKIKLHHLSSHRPSARIGIFG